ncbi:helix-turn-helix domain-containing protein [Amycolatopsis sp. GM8]|uniref:helix-turn-helix domain-containing protein n=1 Tax=Amycolatopsis sp. GM8 TaxID=2896530 RepID=UPI001F2F57A3|nr:helix-turn-helix domain-containing protein [Amycolatopsis sp. GM8]
MSVEAITWALTQAPIPRNRKNASSMASVLVGLANHAGPDGTNAFPAIATLTQYTRLSTRSVQYALRDLEQLGLISPSDPEIIAAYVKRADRRPHGWDLALRRAETPPLTAATPKPREPVDNHANEVHALHPADTHGVQQQPRGVQTATLRGASTAPEPSLNRPGTTRPRQPSRRGRVTATVEPGDRPPAPQRPCGQCDGRPREPVATRLVWHGETAVPCPRCNPRSPHYPSRPGLPAAS